MVLKWCVCVATVLLLSANAFAVQEGSAPAALSFEEFSHKVLAHYPQLKAAHGDVNIALAKAMQAGAGFWPSLDLSVGYKISDDPVNVFGMLLRQERFTSSDFELKRLNTPARHQDFSGGVHVELPLFDAMQTIHRTKSARAALKASEANEVFTRMEALLMAQDAYMNALMLEKLAALADEVQKRSDEDLQKAKDLKDKGMILGADYYLARVMLGDFTCINNEIVRQQKAMTALLNILMGEPSDRDWVLTGEIKEAGVLAQDRQELMEAALAARPDLAALKARFLASQFELSRERSTSLLSLSAFGDATNNRNTIESAGGNNYTVGIKAGMPLFDPAREGRVRESAARKERLEQDIQIFKDNIRRDISVEAARHDAFRDNMTVLKDMTNDAKEAVSLVVPLYSEGRKSIADLLEARRVYWQSAQAYNKALMGIWMSRARLLFLSGRLNEDEMKALAQGAGL